MARRLARHDEAVMVDYYGFCLQDADDLAFPVQWPEGFESVEFVSGRTGRIDVRSAGHTHTAGLVLEVWDEDPGGPERRADREWGWESSTDTAGTWGAWRGSPGGQRQAVRR